MPDLHHMLLDTDLDFLSRVARFWGIDLPMASFQDALESLTAGLINLDLAQEVIQALPAEASEAWQAALKAGRMPYVQFIRKFGEIRIQGEGWRKREEPDLHPISATEMLWYRALVGKGFFGSGGEPQEYIYVPDEFLQFFSESKAESSRFDLRPASAEDHAFTNAAGSGLIDRLSTLLAELRKDSHYPPLQKEPLPIRLAFELALLESAGLVKPGNLVEPDRSREILEKMPGEGLLFYFNEWLESPHIDDLRMLPGLSFEGTWTNPVLVPRQLLVEILHSLNSDTWWSIPSLIAEIKLHKPDFQRPAGDYESWFIRRKADGQYLHGFDSWDEVEGYFIRYLISGPLHWLGLLDLGSTNRGKPAASFKLSKRSISLLAARPPNLPVTPATAVKASSDGKLHLPAGIQAVLHYQAARFCRLEKETAQETVYGLTHDSLKNASEQGLKPTQLTGLLKRAGVVNLPPGFTQLLERYEKFGVEARLERAVLLTVEQPELLALLLKDARAAKCLGEELSPLAAKVKPGSEAALLKILTEMGRLAEIHLDV